MSRWSIYYIKIRKNYNYNCRKESSKCWRFYRNKVMELPVFKKRILNNVVRYCGNRVCFMCEYFSEIKVIKWIKKILSS